MQEETLANIWNHVNILTSKPTLKPVNNLLCQHCSGYKILAREGYVCTECGITEHTYLEETAEWQSTFAEDGRAHQQDPSRCALPVVNGELFSQSWGMGTVMAAKYGTHEQKRLAKINFHNSMNHTDRSLWHAYQDIDEACRGIPEIVLRDAKAMYKKFNEEKLTRGAVRMGIKANCVLYACRLAQVPRTTKEIADMFGIQSKDVSRTTQIFTDTITEAKNRVTKPFDVMQRLLNAFEVTREQRLKCNKLCAQLENCPGLMSKNPNSVATAIIYLVLQDSMSKSDVCQRCSISVPTMNKIITIAKPHLEN